MNSNTCSTTHTAKGLSIECRCLGSMRVIYPHSAANTECTRVPWSRRLSKRERFSATLARKNKIRLDAINSCKENSNFKQLAYMLYLAMSSDDYGGLDYIMGTRFGFDEFGPNIRGMKRKIAQCKQQPLC